ncbi:Protein Mpv17 [Sparganum proliferum]
MKAYYEANEEPETEDPIKSTAVDNQSPEREMSILSSEPSADGYYIRIVSLIKRARHFPVNFRAKFGHSWLLGNVFLCGGFSVLADVVSQSLEQKASKDKLNLEWIRTAAFGCTSLLLAPSVHYWYLLLDKTLLGNTGSILIRKLFYDAVIFSPFYIVAFYALQNSFERDSPESFLKKLNSTGITLWASPSDVRVQEQGDVCPEEERQTNDSSAVVADDVHRVLLNKVKRAR